MKFYKIIALAAAALMTVSAAAQNSTTPYSKMAYGILSDNASGIQRSMGGVGYAMQDGRTINVMNPASYSQVDSLTFLWDFGLDLTNVWSKEGDKSGHSLGGGLDYLTAQFKLAKHLGGSFGLLPYSSVGYSFGNTIDGGNEYRTGSGGLLQLYGGVGYEPIKNLSLGVNVAYLFGTTTNTNTITAESTTLFQRIMQVRDYNLNVGVQYAFNLNKNHKVIVGATYSPKKSLHGHTWGTYYDTQDTKLDSVGYTKLTGKYEQPHTFGAGVSYSYTNKLLVEADFTYQQWAKVKYAPIEGIEASNMMFNNRWKAAAGLQFSPGSRTSYLGAVKFRAGGFYNHDYINVMGNNVRDYGATFGLGFPVPGASGKTTINLGFEWKRRLSAPVTLIQEDYFNITLGVNFNEVWFWKNKIR
ncbi:MAG: hypothetical protein KBT13_11155 [Bacteroidales bacterium]|nr:hypothetical protein [Candidatus Sodaliphilus limicaballi]